MSPLSFINFKLTHSPSCVVAITAKVRDIFITPQKEILYTLAITPHSSGPDNHASNFLSH